MLRPVAPLLKARGSGPARFTPIGRNLESTLMNTARASSKPITVLVADDHPLMREGIASVIRGESDMGVVAEAGNGREAIDRFVEHRPDVTLMDLQMPEVDGIAATLAIRDRWPDARIVMLTTFRGDAQALRALQAGARGYLLKSAIRQDLLDAIRSVHAGKRCIPREVAAELASHVTDDALSARELEVLRRVAGGNSNARVAEQLSLSEETVKSHMKNAMNKLSARDRTHAVMIALKRGLIDG
jgi:DNA-binding NarL/FixJ family response regulator